VIRRRPAKGGKNERVVESVCLRWLIWFCLGMGWWKRRPLWMGSSGRNWRSHGVKSIF